MAPTWSPERARRARLRKRPDPPELSPESPKDKKTESLIPKLLNNSVNRDFWPASAQGLANQAEPMDTFWKAKSLSSTPRRSNLERNDVLL